MRRIIKPGDQFGLLSIIGESSQRGRIRYVNCICKCGNLKEIKLSSLTSEATKSCGCLQREYTRTMNFKNGLYKTRLHSIWENMKQRCNNQNYRRFKDYGGRGIKICDEWLADFKVFYDWSMGHGYDKILTIDRIDNDGGYSPDNCKWSTYTKQNNNRRGTRHAT